MADIDLDLSPIEEAVERVETAVEKLGESVSKDLRQELQSLDGVVKGVERAVERAAQSINESIKEYSWISIARTLYWTVIALAVLTLPSLAWHSKWRYALQYQVDVHKVDIEHEPHDCGFFTAPLGDKYCHYERITSTMRWATSTEGQPIESFDDGRTWSVFVPEAGITAPKNSTVEEVDVTWEKKTD